MHLNNTHGSVQKHRLVACLRMNEWATSDPALPVVGHVEGIFIFASYHAYFRVLDKLVSDVM